MSWAWQYVLNLDDFSIGLVRLAALQMRNDKCRLILFLAVQITTAEHVVP
jgi:hypothetical protein